jgi:hypothetical protein
MDINHAANLLYVACDGGSLVEVEVRSGQMQREWPLAGVPDATFFNPTSDLARRRALEGRQAVLASLSCAVESGRFLSAQLIH